MSSFSGLGFSANNPLMDYFRQYATPQTEQTTDPKRTTSVTSPYEVGSQSELEYIEPDKTGRKQIVDCPAENKVYVGRYNHVRQVMDWRSYVDEGEIKLSATPDSSAEISKIASALVAVVEKLEQLHAEIQEIKADNTPQVQTPARTPAKPAAKPKQGGRSR